MFVSIAMTVYRSTYRLVVVTPDTLDRMLDHPLEYFFVLISLSYQIPDMDEDVLGLIIGYL